MRFRLKAISFCLLSFTWGLPVSIIGFITSVFLLISGHRPLKYGLCFCFEIGERWGGLSLGIFIITDKRSCESIKSHEHGHAFQNCFFGFLMPFAVCIPSALRYWFRKIQQNNKSAYNDIWFERQATRLGQEFMDLYIKNKEETKL